MRLHLITAIMFLATSAGAQTAQPWMSNDVPAAWNQGFTGAGTRIVMVDDFTSVGRIRGNIGLGSQVANHGTWVTNFAAAIAPGASAAAHDFNSRRSVALQANTLNILNLSYSMYASSGFSADQIGWSSQERSIINFANSGQAIVVKAAGNDATIIGSGNRRGTTDYLNSALIGQQSTIFVGALNSNGTPTAKTSLAGYSNRPGTDVTIQNQFVSVGVRRDITGLAGTSFAAPIVSGYAAIIGSKFRTASPTQIANQLLSTARQDTITNYNPALHGRGEASLARALSPVTIR